MELAKKKKKSMKEQPFKPEVDTGIENQSGDAGSWRCKR